MTVPHSHSPFSLVVIFRGAFSSAAGGTFLLVSLPGQRHINRADGSPLRVVMAGLRGGRTQSCAAQGCPPWPGWPFKMRWTEIK